MKLYSQPPAIAVRLRGPAAADLSTAAEGQLVNAADHEAMRTVRGSDDLRRRGVLIVEEAERFDVLREGVGADQGQAGAIALFHLQLERVVPELPDGLEGHLHRAELRVRQQQLAA